VLKQQEVRQQIAQRNRVKTQAERGKYLPIETAFSQDYSNMTELYRRPVRASSQLMIMIGRKPVAV
jgi:hypothetical protein